ncbi:MAG: DUF1697 domain-containing protein [Solirubrobacteraceae bacterium]
MQPVVLMLRGINLGPSRRIAMPQLRDALTEAGLSDVRTYVQSGNVVARSGLQPAAAEQLTQRTIERRFGFDVPVVARTRGELADVVKRNPLGAVATDPKRHQVSFLSQPLDPAVAERLLALPVKPEAIAIHGREIYAWHPDGVARSKLWNGLAAKGLGVTATARNWTTVTTLQAMADELES